MDVLCDNVNALNLDSYNWEQSLQLIQELIRCHPVYGSEGIEKAQNCIRSYMQRNCWDDVIECSYWPKDLQAAAEYVDVAAFGEHYANYDSFIKRNIIGIIEGYAPGPTLLLNGHVDVDIVSDKEQWSQTDGWCLGTIIDGRLIGRGACDMLAGLVSLITVANILKMNRDLWKGRIIVMSVVDEEIGGNGTLAAMSWLSRNNYLQETITECLIAEPSNGQICVESLGFLHLLMEFKRSPVHMGVASKQNNALWDMQKLIGLFDELLFKAAKSLNASVQAEQLIFNFGVIKGGMDSALPISCIQLEGTVFFPEELEANELVKALKECIECSGIQIQLKMGNFGFKGAKFKQNKLAKTLTNLPYRAGIFPSPCDARLMKKYDIPTIIFGPGKLQQAHATNEYIELNDVKHYVNHILCNILKYFEQ